MSKSYRKSNFRFSGIEDLEGKLKDAATMRDVKDVVKKNGADLQEGMMRRAVFKGHYEGKKFIKPTGTTKRSIALNIREFGLTARVYPTTEYSSYLEYGTRFMNAQPFIKPAFFIQQYKFVKDLSRLMK